MFNLRNLSAAVSTLTLTLTLALSAASLHAEDLASSGRKIFAKHHQATVTVQIVLKNKMSVGGVGGSSSESKQEVTGTVIDPSGLTNGTSAWAPRTGSGR